MAWWYLLKTAIKPSDQDSGLQMEVETHLALLEADEVRRGASPDEARRRARKRFGDSLDNRGRAGGRDRFGWMADFAVDLRFTLRQFAHAPSFVVTTTLLVGLGIGVNAAIFTLLNRVVLHSLPLPHPERLVVMLEEMPGGGNSPPSWLDQKDFREQNHVFDSLAAYAYDGGFLLNTDGDTRRVIGGYVTPDYFSTLEAAPIMGRLFDAHDAESGNNAVALVREDFWRNVLNADPLVIGREVELNGQKTKIIGVLPGSFRFPFDTAVVWSPLMPKPSESASRGFHGFPMIGRLRPGVTVEQATADLSAIMKRLSTAYPNDDPERVRITLFPLQQWSVGQSANRLLVLQCAAFAIFLMTCANVSSLLLTRYAGRRREFALRAALGASSLRQARQHLTESLLLAGIGCMLGVAVAYEGVKFLLHLYGTTLPRTGEIQLDGRLVFFTISVTLVGAIVFGLTTALHSRSRQLDMDLREGGRNTGSRSGALTRKMLVAAQVASAVTLMAGATELIRSFQALMGVDAGFRANDLLTMRVSLPERQYTKPQQVSSFYSQVVNLLSELPQVKGAATINLLPLQQSGYNGGISVPGLPLPPKSLVVEYRWIDGDFFRVMGIPLLRGRTFLPEEANSERPNAIINEGLERVLWGNKDPINWPIDTSANPARVVGVTRDARESGLEHLALPAMYFPLASRSSAQTEQSLVVRSSIPPATLASLIRRKVHGIDSRAAIYRVKPMEEVVEDSLGYARITATLLSLMASLALVLAAFGLYGVLSFAVEERMREFAIRIAVGANSAQLVGLVFGQCMGIVGIGLTFGLVGVWIVTQVLPNVLYGVHTVDAGSLLVSLGVLTAAAMLAIAVPAGRATRVDPILMLRQD